MERWLINDQFIITKLPYLANDALDIIFMEIPPEYIGKAAVLVADIAVAVFGHHHLSKGHLWNTAVWASVEVVTNTGC